MSAVDQPLNLGRGVLSVKDVIVILVAVVGIVGSGGIAYGFLRSDVTGLGKRADTIDASIVDMQKKIGETRDTTLELRVHQRTTSSQLNRIETLLGGTPPKLSPNP